MSKHLIALIGHSVVRLSNGDFLPSDLIQEVSPTREGKFLRTGIDNPDLDWNSPSAYLGGGKAVVQAAMTCHRDEDLVIIGGRAAYLDNVADDKDITEASVMREELRRAGLDELWQRAKMVGDTRTTEDDMRTILTMTQEESYELTKVILMTFRIPRASALMADIVARSPGLAQAAERVALVAAEMYLPDLRARFEKMIASAAYRRTMSNEQEGIRKLLSGSYTKGGEM